MIVSPVRQVALLRFRVVLLHTTEQELRQGVRVVRAPLDRPFLQGRNGSCISARVTNDIRETTICFYCTSSYLWRVHGRPFNKGDPASKATENPEDEFLAESANAL